MAEGRIPCAAAEQMNVTKPSVTNATRLLREGGFLTMDEDKRIHLTELSRETFEKIKEAWQGHLDQKRGKA